MVRTTLIILFCVLSCAAVGQKQFWGTSSLGGNNGNGFIFRTDSIGDNLVIIHHFKSAVDGNNIGALLHASNDKLYGLASSGGQNAVGVFSGGTLFEYDLATDQFNVIQHFGPANTALPNIYLPRGEGTQGLTEVSPGVLYGLMQQGEYVFSYNINTGVFTKPFTIPTYNGGATNGVLRNRINAAFFKASDGFLYTTTFTNSTCPIPNPYMGSIFRVNPANNTLTIPYKNTCIFDNGHYFTGSLVESNGKFYGTTLYGGVNYKGVIYEYNPASNVYTKKYDFNGGTSTYEPTSLAVATNGKLYGTAYGGGVPETNLPSGGGVLFELDLTTNTFTKKYDFLLNNSWLGDMGTFPRGLIRSTNGKLYGVTQFGVFEYNTTTSETRMAGRFWTGAFDASITQVCRKPAYQFQSVTTFDVCAGANFTLDLASNNALSATWKHNTIVDPSKTTPVLSFTSFTAADAGTWICTLTNECGTTTTQTITLQVNAPAQPSILADGPLEFCEGHDVTLAAPQGFSDYEWSTGETSRTITVSENGSYSVRVSNGCESPLSQAVYVTVHALPPAPSAVEATTLHSLKVFGSTSEYQWMTDNTILEAKTSEITVNASGLYKAYSINAAGCLSADFASLQFVACTNPDYQHAVVKSYDVCKGTPFSVDLGTPDATSITWKHNNTIDALKNSAVLNFTSFTNVDAGEWICTLTNACGTTTVPPITLTLTDNTPVVTRTGTVLQTNNSGTYQWIDCNNNGAILSGEATQTLRVTKSGSYAVIVNGICQGTSACVSVVITANEETVNSGFSLYPNPVSDELNVVIPETVTIRSVLIYNAMGQAMLRSDSPKTTVSSLAPGVYYLIVTTNVGMWRAKFVRKSEDE